MFILSTSESAAETVATEVVEIGFGTVIIDLIMAVLFAWAGYQIIKWIFGKLLEENKKLNGEYQEVGNKTSVVIDGEETTIDMTIDGVEVDNTQEESSSGVDGKKDEPIPTSVKFMFIISGIYLVATWLMNTIYGFII